MIKRQYPVFMEHPCGVPFLPIKKVLKKLNLYDKVQLFFMNGGLLKNVWNYISIKVTN